jgi:3-phosphoshikimate 1-carboxyvinyltransferase
MDVMIQGGSPLTGELHVPPDKSISHRAVIFGALAQGRSIVRNFLRSEDTLATVRCLRGLGITVEDKEKVLEVHGNGLRGLREPSNVLDCGNSGTTMRLLAGMVASYSFLTILTGDDSLRNRPMGRVIKPLMLMGTSIEGRKNGVYAPLVIKGGQLRPISYRLPVASAQVKSAILLAALGIEGETEIRELAPSRDHTERMLKAMGARLQVKDKVIHLTGGHELSPQEYTIPGDISSAAFWLVAASLVPGSELILRDVGINPSRTGVIKVLRQMGASIQTINERLLGGEAVADLIVRSAPLKGVDIGGEIIPTLIDEIPILAVAMASAKGESVVRGAQELRVKETDRIKAICDNLKALGVEIEEMSDGFWVRGSAKFNGAEVDSFGDHRLAMAMGIAGLLTLDPVRLTRAEAVNISYPGFWDDLNRLILGGN